MGAMGKGVFYVSFVLAKSYLIGEVGKGVVYERSVVASSYSMEAMEKGVVYVGSVYANSRDTQFATFCAAGSNYQLHFFSMERIRTLRWPHGRPRVLSGNV